MPHQAATSYPATTYIIPTAYRDKAHIILEWDINRRTNGHQSENKRTSIGEQTDINRRNNGELTEKYRGKSASHQPTRVRLASKYFNNKKYIFYIRHT